MNGTTFAPSADQALLIMAGHNFDGSPLPNAKTGPVIVGSGGLYSTPRDLLAWLQWHLDRFGNERPAERLIDHAAYLWRDGLNAVFGMDESGHMDAMGLGWVIMAPEGDRPLILQKAAASRESFPMPLSLRRAASASAPPSMRSTSTRVWRWPRPRTISSWSLRRDRRSGPQSGDHSSGTPALRSPSAIRSRWRRKTGLSLSAKLRKRASE